MSDAEIRTIGDDELDAWLRMMFAAFSAHPRAEELEAERMIAEPARYLAAFEDDRIVGGNASIGLELTVPGGARVPVAAINGVGVLPSHTRRGISTALMRRQIDATHERGEPIAVLHASEAAIYGRYGFGMATRNASFTVDRARSRFVRGYEPHGDVVLADRDEALRTHIAVLESQATRPGHLGPVERLATWDHRQIELDPDEKDEPLFYAVHRDAVGSADGVAVYRSKHSWPDDVPQVKIVLYVLAGATPQAEADLWRFVCDLDLVATIEAWGRPIDDPLFRLLREPRALRMRIADGLHLRLVDLPSALRARSYAHDGRIVLHVDDGFCPWNEGTWSIAIDDGTTRCEPTDEAPELALTATDLASTYLGDATFHELRSALRVHERAPGAVDRADRLFGSRPAPWSWAHV